MAVEPSAFSWIDAATAIGTLAAAVATAIAAWAAWRAASATKTTVQDQLFANLMAEYAAPEMGEALRLLPDIESLMVRGVVMRKLPAGGDDARRKLHWFYKKLWTLYRMDAISEGHLRVLSSFQGYTLWRTVALPASRSIDPGEGADQYYDWAQEYEQWYRNNVNAAHGAG